MATTQPTTLKGENMTHEKAFDLTARYAPNSAGQLWNTTDRTGCDTAWAVADQYSDDETDQAIADLQLLESGTTPEGWEPA